MGRRFERATEAGDVILFLALETEREMEGLGIMSVMKASDKPTQFPTAILKSLPSDAFQDALIGFPKRQHNRF